MNTIAQLRAQALRSLGVDPFDMAAMRRILGGVGAATANLSQLRRNTLRHFGVDPYSQRALEQAITARGGQMPAPRVAKPRKARSPRPGVPRPRAASSPKLFIDFIASGCKNLKLAAKVLGITPTPPLRRDAIRAAWIALIAKHHPDKGGVVESAQAVNAAYQLLKKFAN